MDNVVTVEWRGNRLRVVERKQHWWVLIDVCRVLGLSNPAQVAERLGDDEKGICSIDTPGGPQKVIVVNEPGLYAVINESRKPIAEELRHFLHHDVMPALHRGEMPDRYTTALMFQKIDALTNQMQRVETCLGGVENEVADLSSKKQTDFFAEDEKLVLQCCLVNYDGMCANDRCVRIVDERGCRLPDCHIDHNFGRQGQESRNRANAFPVAGRCNQRLRDPAYRTARFPAFQQFQSFLAAHCQPLFHAPPSFALSPDPPPDLAPHATAEPPSPVVAESNPDPPPNETPDLFAEEEPRSSILTRDMSHAQRQRWAARKDSRNFRLFEC
jgi:prophage antirepressor-like protein